MKMRKERKKGGGGGIKNAALVMVSISSSPYDHIQYFIIILLYPSFLFLSLSLVIQSLSLHKFMVVAHNHFTGDMRLTSVWVFLVFYYS